LNFPECPLKTTAETEASVMSKGSTPGYDELPKPKEEGHGLHEIAGLIVLALLLVYWWRQPRTPPALHAQDMAIQGIHLGQDYQEVVKLRGKAKTDQKIPDGSRRLVYSAAESYFLKSDRVDYMEARGAGGVQFPQGEVKVGDSRDSIEKLLGVVESARNAQVTQVTWPGPDCRFTVEFDADWKARAFRVYSP